MARDLANLVWREKTWSERAQTVAIFVVATAVVLAMSFFALVYAVGPSLDGISRYNSEHRRCLQRATNGYEIQQCR